MYAKEEPPSSISGRTHRGRLDFIVSTATGHFAGIEIKNVREWMYPARDEVRELLAKCTALDVVPVLIARRIPYVTFKLLNAFGTKDISYAVFAARVRRRLAGTNEQGDWEQ